MSDTFFSGAPHWTWFIIPYFFVGGLAGGAYFLAAALDWFARPEARPVVRTGSAAPPVGATPPALPLPTALGRPCPSCPIRSRRKISPAPIFKVCPPSPSAPW